MEAIIFPVAQSATWNLSESATTALRNLCAIAGAKGFVSISATDESLSLIAQTQKYTTAHCLWRHAPDGCTPGAATLAAADLSRAIGKTGAILIALEGETARITAGGFTVSLLTKPDVFPHHQAFPRLQEADTSALIDDWHPVRDAIRTVATFASRELARGAIMNGLHLQFAPKALWNENAGEDTLSFTATDGHILRHATVPVRTIIKGVWSGALPAEGSRESAVMPAELIAALRRLKLGARARASGTLAIAKGWILAEVHLGHESGSYLFRDHAVDGTYPNIASIMPAAFLHNVPCANTIGFAQALRNAIEFRARTERVGRYDCVQTRIEQAKHDLQLQVSHGDYTDTVFCEHVDAWHESSWNAQLLLHAIESLECEWFLIAQKSSLGPAILWDPHTKNGFAMVMPLRIDKTRKAKGAK
jgi:DNA polymerase III sliding clamp (beta) subunit (PCNA family)